MSSRALHRNPLYSGFLSHSTPIHSSSSLSFRVRRNQKTRTAIISGNGATLPLTDGFPIEDDEFDLDSPTEGFSPIPEAIEDIHQGKVVFIIYRYSAYYVRQNYNSSYSSEKFSRGQPSD